MKSAELVQLIIAISTLVTSIGGVLAVLKGVGRVNQVAGQVHTVQTLVNGRLDQLLDLTRQSSHAQGVLQGQAGAVSALQAVATIPLAPAADQPEHT